MNNSKSIDTLVLELTNELTYRELQNALKALSSELGVELRCKLNCKKEVLAYELLRLRSLRERVNSLDNSNCNQVSESNSEINYEDCNFDIDYDEHLFSFQDYLNNRFKVDTGYQVYKALKVNPNCNISTRFLDVIIVDSCNNWFNVFKEIQIILEDGIKPTISRFKHIGNHLCLANDIETKHLQMFKIIPDYDYECLI